MKTSRRNLLVVLLILTTILVPIAAVRAAEPLPGTCGLPSADSLILAFAGPAVATDVPVFDFDMKSCQEGTLGMSYVFGCGSDYYSTNPGHGALNLSLAQAGFHTPNGSTTTLLDVISHAGGQTYDPYLEQAVTAYLNSLYVEGYAYDAQAVLDGYHGGAISEGSFAWHNHGATSQFVIPSCPLSASGGSAD